MRWEGLWGGLNDSQNFTDLCKVCVTRGVGCECWRRAVLGKPVQWHSWRETGPRAATCGVGKACGVVTGSGETQLVGLLVLLATAEVVGLGVDVSYGW